MWPKEEPFIDDLCSINKPAWEDKEKSGRLALLGMIRMRFPHTVPRQGILTRYAFP